MRISDWSSDVCSSDLDAVIQADRQIIAVDREHAAGKAIVERSRALICAESPWIAEHQRDSVLVHRRSRVVGRLMLAASYEHNIKATAGEEQAHESGKGRRIKRDQRTADKRKSVEKGKRVSVRLRS